MTIVYRYAFYLAIALTAVQWGMQSATAEELYKYVNEDGVTVLDSHVPPQFVKNGYTVLSSDGRVLEVVPRALTPAEVAAEQKRRETEAEDAALMRLYGSPEDVVRARDTKLASLQGFVDAARNNLDRFSEQKREAEASVADVERTGGKISQESLDRIEMIQSRIDQAEAEIKSKSDEIEALKQQYARDLKRVTKLYEEKKASS